MKIIVPAPEAGLGSIVRYPTLDRGIQVLDDDGKPMDGIAGIDIRIRPGEVVKATVIHVSPQCEIHAEAIAGKQQWATVPIDPAFFDKCVDIDIPPHEAVPVLLTIKGHGDPRVDGEYRKIVAPYDGEPIAVVCVGLEITRSDLQPKMRTVVKP